MPHPQITIVVPVFNEAGNIPNVLSEAAEVFAEAFESFEIIAVDDGSSDESWAALETASAADPRIRPIRHPKRSGKSGHNASPMPGGSVYPYGAIVSSTAETDASVPCVCASLSFTTRSTEKCCTSS